MKRASSRPQQLKEQLLQAIDAQNNIQNTMAVLDVICCLENFPMTKEALVETRLGKLINDVRKRSTDEDLVKRLKNLIRRWQRLVEVNEVTAKELSSFADNSTSAECIPGSTQTLTENYSRTLFHSTMSEKAEMSQGSVPDKTIKYPNNFRKSKIPVRAIKPYSSSIKHLQQSTSWRTSLSNHQSQNDNSITDQHKFERKTTSASHSDEKHFLAAKEPAQSTSITSNLQNSSIQDSYVKMQKPSDLLNILKPAALNGILDEVSSTVTDTNIRGFEDKARKKQHNSHTVKLDGEDSTKTAQLQAGKQAYDPHTQAIQPISSKTFTKDCQRSTGSEIQDSEHLKNSLRSFQQTNWREMSQSKMIQNSLLISEKSGMSFSVGENIKQQIKNSKECRKTHGFIQEFPVTDLPGVSREVTERDLIRIRSQRWHGVNGCYDNWNNWYDWTQSISLDPYGDGSKFRILPYVGVDYRL
ncbi:mediator of RNA polymerase II transcription subunit 26-like isoform X2 [Onychostoma macrolepis]|uniref:mediator of RNA polymerase II transcription subunit 26-like isoform X2 n=1 Tax=Onychostoma macrolepis TaxID=369639 RepID=UPI00272B89D0|nr:mediator of RNA polymerase II transcription subunit 26-like isoform X2 [Onychostoma macrolepis]